MIKEDLSYAACISFNRNIDNKDYHRELLGASKEYIKNLEKIQRNFHTQLYSNSKISKKYSNNSK